MKNPSAQSGPSARSPEFISEAIKPSGLDANTTRMSMGEPGLPTAFIWRQRTCTVRSVRRQWKETVPCRHGSGEQYLRKHWYEIESDGGVVMTVYFERQARSLDQAKCRWWLFSITQPTTGEDRPQDSKNHE